MIDPRILNSRCKRFIYFCQIGLISPTFKDVQVADPPRNITRCNHKYNDLATIHGIVNDKLIYFGPMNYAEIMLQLHYSGIHTCVLHETGEDVKYDIETAKHYYSLTNIKSMPDKISDCGKCMAIEYCQNDKMPPIYHKDLFIDCKFVLGVAEASTIGISLEGLSQWETVSELREWLEVNSCN